MKIKTMLLSLLVISLGALMVMLAPLAHADTPCLTCGGGDWPYPAPDIGAECRHADLNGVVQSTAGDWVRCSYQAGVPFYHWILNDGVTQPDAWVDKFGHVVLIHPPGQ